VAANSAIEWTDRTWQLTCGCLLYSSGCAHCYAERMAARLKAMALADLAHGKDPGRKRHYIDAIGDDGRWSGKVVPIPEALDDPLHWRKPAMVFVDSMSDLFYGDERDRKACEAKGIPFTPVPYDFLDRAFAVMERAPQHTFQVLTKRSCRLADYVNELLLTEVLPKLKQRLLARNIWIGCSAEDQKQAMIRHRDLVDVPAAVRFWSLEPLLGPIDALPLKGISWVIVGGESGREARPCRQTWVRDIVRQCADAGVLCFVKQLGSNAEEGYGVHRKLQLEHSKGGDPAEWPKDLRVRQIPALS
jgi:protein gp37